MDQFQTFESLIHQVCFMTPTKPSKCCFFLNEADFGEIIFTVWNQLSTMPPERQEEPILITQLSSTAAEEFYIIVPVHHKVLVLFVNICFQGVIKWWSCQVNMCFHAQYWFVSFLCSLICLSQKVLSGKETLCLAMHIQMDTNSYWLLRKQMAAVYFQRMYPNIGTSQSDNGNPQEKILFFCTLWSQEDHLLTMAWATVSCTKHARWDVSKHSMSHSNMYQIVMLECCQYLAWSTLIGVLLHHLKQKIISVAPLVLLRHPVKRAISHFYYSKKMGWEDLRGVWNVLLEEYLANPALMKITNQIWFDGQVSDSKIQHQWW